MLCLGLDSGTTTCKGLVLDADTGKVLAQTSEPHRFVEGLPHRQVAQDPQIWSEAAEQVTERCLEKIGERRNEVVAFGVSAQQHGLVTLDDRNQPVRPAKLWCDTSTAEQAEKLNRAFGDADALIERTGNAMVAGYTAPLFGWEMQALEKNVARSQPGANGLTFLPFFYGERLPNLPNGSALIHGLNSGNTNRHDIARALVEGIVVSLAHGMKRLSSLGIEAKELRITGGGARSASMRQVVTDILGLPVIGFKVAERAALGAAIHAAWTYCQTKGQPIPLEKIVKLAVKTDRRTRAEPRKENQALYAELRGRHADLTGRLAGSGYL